MVIAAATFEDILTIVNLGIVQSLSFTKIEAITGEAHESMLKDLLYMLF